MGDRSSSISGRRGGSHASHVVEHTMHGIEVKNKTHAAGMRLSGCEFGHITYLKAAWQICRRTHGIILSSGSMRSVECRSTVLACSCLPLCEAQRFAIEIGKD